MSGPVEGGVQVFAAGGVLTREGDRGPQVAIVHRPRYDDWTLPKGKLLSGESFEDAARREILEETGFDCELIDELPSSRYVDHLGRPKLVRYWRVSVAGGAFDPNDEVDELRWLSRSEALALLSYPRDREVLAAAELGDG